MVALRPDTNHIPESHGPASNDAKQTGLPVQHWANVAGGRSVPGGEAEYAAGVASVRVMNRRQKQSGAPPAHGRPV